MRKGKKMERSMKKTMLLSFLSVLLIVGLVSPTNVQALGNVYYNEETLEVETEELLPQEEVTEEVVEVVNQETFEVEENLPEEEVVEVQEEQPEEIILVEETTEENQPEETTTEEQTQEVVEPTVEPTIEPTEEPLPTETPEVIEEEEASINNKEEEEVASEEVVERIKLEKTRILKAPPSGSNVTVNAWGDLKALGAEDNGVWVISNNYTIKLGNDLVACTPIKITGDVNITSDTPHTIYREKGNANFTVFTVENNGKLTLGDKVTMSGKIAETYGSKYKITVTDGYGTPIYETTVYDDETRTPLQILDAAGLSDESDTGKSNIYNLIGQKTSTDPDSPYSLGYKLQPNKPLDMAGKRDTQMKDVKADLLIAAQWVNPDKNKKMYVVDGYGNEIYSVEVLANSTKTPRDLLTEAGINDRDNPNNIATVLQQKLSNVDGPYKLGYTFNGWELNQEGNKQFKEFSGDFYVVAKWIGVYKITITDGYERVLDTIAVPANSTKTPKEILQEKGYYTREQAASLIASKTASDPTSPYSLGYLLLGNNAHWDMADQRTTQMKDVGGDLLITAKWVVPEKDLNLRVTDGAGNTIFTSTDKSKPIQQLMAEKGLNANAADQSAEEKNAIANKVGSSAESPANDTNYSFNSWDFGGVDKTKTLAQIDGNVVVCAAWNPPSEVEYVWEVPNLIEEGMKIEIGIGGKFMGVNANGNTQWANNYNSNDEKWVIANVQDNTFEIVNKAHPTEKLWVKQSANNAYTAQSENGFKYSTGADANPTQAYTRFKFATIGTESYLACVGNFQHYQGAYPEKTVYMVGNPGNQAIFFSDNAGLGAAVHVGKPTKKYDNPDTPGKTDVPGPGTPGGSEQVAGVTPAVGPTDNDPNDAPGTQGHNTSTGSVPQTTKTKESGKVTPVTGLTSSDIPIKSDSIQDARYTLDGANQTQIFDKNGKGFFVQVNNGGTLNIEGANLQDLKTGLLNDQGVMEQDTSVENSAPVVVDGGTMNFTSGSIQNNSVGYAADDGKSGMQVTGSNSEGNGVKNYIKSITPTKSAGGAIFKNGAKVSIYGDAAIKQNHGDVGGILVNGQDTYVVVGGQFEPNCGYVTQTGGHIDQNVGFHYAGAALVENGAVLRLVGTATMNHNVTWNRGGAVWATDWGTAATPNKNYKAKTVTNLSDKWEKEGVFIMTGGEMAYNTAFVRAGAVEVESNSVFLRQGYIHDNYCRSLGGAIYVEGDFRGIYWYTLHIEEGYIGQNYAVRFRNNMNETVTAIGGNYDGKTIEQMNNILDRKLGQVDADGNPLVDSNFVTYPRRTSDFGDFVTDRQYMGNGGGIWLCPLGGSVVVNLTDEHKVYVDHNYASGHYQGVQAKGTDFYLHNSPDGHLILVSDYHKWVDEESENEIETEHAIYSGSLYLRNDTEQVNYDNTTHTASVGGASVGGILIVNNVSRDGGGIAADGLVAFGTADETNEHGAEIELTKTWSEATDEKKPLVFKLFYLDKNGQEQPIIDENGVQSSFVVSQYTSGEDEYNSSSITESWKARANVPNIVKIVENGEVVPYPLYLLNHPNYSDDLNPANPGDVQKIAQLNADYPNAQFTIKEDSLQLVIREYDEDGNEIKDVALSDITLTNVDVTSSQINEYDENSCEYKTKANVHYSVAGLNATAVNGEQPAVEKYINGVVHKDLYSYDSVFEYEILAYVPLNATEFIIYDTLEKELMFWNAVKQIPQYTTDNSGNEILNSAFNLSSGNIRIINENEQAIYMFNTNNHLGDGSANASVNQRKNGTKLTEIRNNNTGDYIIRYNLAQSFINGDEIEMPTSNVNNADTIFVKIDKDHIEKVRGKWIALSFNAGIRPSWKDVNKLKNEGTGWLVDSDNKTGSPIKSVYKIEGEALPSNLTGTAWEYVVGRGLEELVDLVDIVEIAKKPTEDNSSYRFAKDRYGNYYALKEQPSEETWSIVDEHADVFPTIQNVQERMAENNSYGFTIYKPTKVYTYSFGQPEDHLIAALQESDQLHEGEVIIAGAFGDGQNMFAKTSEGRYFYRQKPSDLTDPTIWQTLTPWVEATASTSPTLAMAIERVDNGNNLNTRQGDNGKMRLTYSYNWPVRNAQVPHSGEKNQAKYLVTTNKGKSTYKTNIVTVDVKQPEKYVNDKVHDVLRHDSSTKGSFDQPFEYEIMVYVPEDAQEMIIYDTLRDDIMFVDRHGKTQYKTYTIGTSENNDFTDLQDRPNTEFMTQRDGDSTIGQSMVSNTSIRYTGSGWALISDFNLVERSKIDKAAQGPTRYFIKTKDPIKYYFREKAAGSQWTLATTTTNPNEEFVSGRITIAENGTDATITLLNLATTGSDSSEKMLEIFNDNDHKGDGTGTVSKNNGQALNEPITTAGYIMIGDAPTNPNNVTMPTTNKKTGNTIYLKIDESTGIAQARGKWVKLSFNAQIKPTKYANIVYKINKRSRHTTDASQAVDPNKPAGYYYRLSTHTPDKMNAVGYDIDNDSVPNNQKVGHYRKDANGNFTVFYQNTNPSGTEGTDYIWAYNAEKTYFAETLAKLPDAVKTNGSINNNLVQAVYLRKGWDDVQDNDNDGLDDNVVSWEKVTDDGYVIDGENLYNENGIYKYIDVQEDGSHAGLANHANYAVKLDNEWHYSKTNTVTVVPLLRTLTFNKLWIVDENTKLPTAKDLKDHLKLFWERIDNVVPTSTDHGKTVGEITGLYKNNITITSEKVEQHGESTRYTWKIEIVDLPQLRPSMKYYVEESLIEGFEWADYINPEDPEATSHAHDKGTIINSKEDKPDETRLLVKKKWDVADKDAIANESIQVQLMQKYNGTQYPVYERDGNNKVVFEQKADGTYLLGNDGNYYLTTATLPTGVTDANTSRRYSPKVDSKSIQTINKTSNWVYEWRPIPRFARDVNGNIIYKTDENGVQIVDESNKPIPVEIEYSIELLSDPEGYILSTKEKKNINVHEGMTNILEKAYDVETYTYPDPITNQTPGGRKEGTWKRAEVVAVEKITLEYVDDGIGNTTLVETGRRFLEGSELEQKLAELNATDRAQFEVDCKNGAKSSELPSTPGSSVLVPQEQYACYYRTLEEYDTYEVDLINTKPQIEKYINKDVHLETFFGNEFIYDIMVYVPDEATEIEITDELLPTLKLKSFLEPIITGAENRLVEGYKEYGINSLPATMEVAVHAENNHTINGTVDTMKSNITQNTVSGSGISTVTVDGNSFKVKLTDIVHYGADYVPYELGEYVKVADTKGENIQFVKENAIPDGYVRRDKERYRAVATAYYIEDTNGTYVRVKDANNENYHFVENGQIPTGYERADNKLYSLKESSDQKLGGRYVQVTFKAGFNLDVVDTDEFKSFLQSNASKPSSNNKEQWDDYDWDVIKTTYNKAWDEYIESLGYQRNTHQYVLANNTVPEPIAELKMQIGTSNISKAVKNGDKYYGAIVGNDYYIYPMNLTTDSQYNNQWLKVLGNPIRYFTLDNLETPVKSGSTLDGSSDYWFAGNNSYIQPIIDNGTNLITNETTYVPVVPNETYIKIDDQYYLEDVAKLYAPKEKYDAAKDTKYKKIDWGRGDGDVIRNNTSPYSGDHAGIVNTASYEVTYGNKYKSTHKSNTVTVVPEVYNLPHSGGIGTYWHTIAGTGLLTLAAYYALMERKRRKQSKAS